MDEYEIIHVTDLSNLNKKEKNQYQGEDSKPKGKFKRFISDASLFITIPILVISIVSMVFSIKSYIHVTQNMQGGVFYIENGNDAANGEIVVDSFIPTDSDEGEGEVTTAGTVVIVTNPSTGAPVTIKDNTNSSKNNISSNNATTTKASNSTCAATTTRAETTTQTEKTTAKPASTTAKPVYTGIVNINTASKSELMSLNGIGEVKAQAIIDYREANGQFSVIEEIMQVSGIGEKTFEKIKNRITVG